MPAIRDPADNSGSANLRLIKVVPNNNENAADNDIRVSLPPELSEEIIENGDGVPKVYWAWCPEHQHPVVSNKSLHQEQYIDMGSSKLYRYKGDEDDLSSKNDKISPPYDQDQNIDFATFVKNSDQLYWVATDEMLSDGGVFSAYILNSKQASKLLNTTSDAVLTEYCTAPRLNTTDTQELTPPSESDTTILGLFLDIFRWKQSESSRTP